MRPTELPGLPPTRTQAVLLPVAYFTGDDFKPAGGRAQPLERLGPAPRGV